ncbi:MAG: YcgL domain-containing protein [Proteobacteria bacterium]|nr:YcgL domain-containing protein [Pseudomonadota bacterium]
MHAFVYKSRRKADTYVYLRERNGFALLPEPLRSTLGPLDFVLDLALDPGRKLAREDASSVRANLAARGYHLQFPPVGGGDTDGHA